MLTLPPKHTRLLRVDLTPDSSVDTWPDCSTRARTNANKAAQADTERGREGPIMRALAARATPHAGLTPRFGPSGLRLASADLLHAARERTPQPRRCTRETSRTQTRSGHVQHKRHTSGAGVRDRPQKFAGALRPGRLATAIPHWGQQPQVGEREARQTEARYRTFPIRPPAWPQHPRRPAMREHPSPALEDPPERQPDM